MYVLVIARIFEGSHIYGPVKFIGPFDNEKDAYRYADNFHCKDKWEVHPIENKN